MELLDKIAIVTGGTKGIGKAISVKLAENGARVIALARNINGDLKLSESFEINSRISFKSCDVSDFDETSKVVEEIQKEFGRIDILVNNAGITKDNLLLRMSEKDWDDVININLKGMFNTCKVISRYMLSQRSGKIINIGSIVGTTGNAGQSNYSASKAGAIGFTKSLAKELASRNILVNLIAPGYVLTEMTDKLTEDQINAFKENIPLKRAAQPEDIASVVEFFASEKSNYITGQVLHVDGGLAI